MVVALSRPFILHIIFVIVISSSFLRDLHGEIYRRKISVSGLGLALFGSFFHYFIIFYPRIFIYTIAASTGFTVLFFNDHSGRNKHWLVLEL